MILCQNPSCGCSFFALSVVSDSSFPATTFHFILLRIMAISAVNPNRRPGRFLNTKSTYALVTEPVKTAYVPYTRDEKNYIILYVCMYVCMYYTPRSYFLSTPFLYILIKFFIIFLVKLYHITNKMSSVCQFSSDSKAHTSRQAKFCLPWFL